MKTTRSVYARAKDHFNERCLDTRVEATPGRMLSRRIQFPCFVLNRERPISQQPVSEPDEVPPAGTIGIHDMNKKTSNESIPTVDPMLRNPNIPRVIVSKRRHAVSPIVGQRVRSRCHCNVDNRLRSNARHSGAADVLNVQCLHQQQRAYLRPFCFKQGGPLWIVRDQIVVSVRKT